MTARLFFAQNHDAGHPHFEDDDDDDDDDDDEEEEEEDEDGEIYDDDNDWVCHLECNTLRTSNGSGDGINDEIDDDNIVQVSFCETLGSSGTSR